MIKTEVSPQPLTVTQLTASIQESLRGEFSNVLVVGEVSDLLRAQSGHCYFQLKDAGARIAAVIWRGVAAALKFKLEEGQQFVCRGSLDVYPPRGSYQLVVQSIQPVGIGPLELAFQQLHARLKQEGLFNPARKRPLPTFPARIAVVTSPQGAALRDFVEVLSRRWPAADLTLIPTRVQGEGAAGEIAGAIRDANRVRPNFDVLVVCRGGGSLEDLWAFNEEPVCRAVFQSAIPVVSGVGHEVDVTLCDLTADFRALTPSEAAERIVPDRRVMLDELQNGQTRIANALLSRWRTAQQTVDMLSSRPVLQRPLDRIELLRQKLTDQLPGLARLMEKRLDAAKHRAAEAAARLESLSPLAILERGYCIVGTSDNQVVQSTTQLKAGDRCTIRFHDGTVNAKIEAST